MQPTGLRRVPRLFRGLGVGWLRLLVLAAVSAAITATTVARAQVGPLPHLIVHRSTHAMGCPDTEALAASVNRIVGKPAIGTVASPSPTVLEVHIDRTPSEHNAIVRVRGKTTGTRSIRDDDTRTCDGLADAVALTIALILDSLESSPPPAKPPPPWRSPPRHPSPKQGPKVSMWMGAGAAVTLGVLEQGGPALQGEIGLQTRTWFTSSLGLLWIPRQEQEFATGRVGTSLTAITMQLCGRALGERETARLLACAVPAAGVLRGDGSGYSRNRAVWRPWLGLGVAGVGRGPVAGPLGWTAHVTVLRPLRDERFSVEGIDGIAFEPSPVALMAGVGVTMSIW